MNLFHKKLIPVLHSLQKARIVSSFAVLVLVFVFYFLSPTTAYGAGPSVLSSIGAGVGEVFGDVITLFLSPIAAFLFMLSGVILDLSAWLLDFSIAYTLDADNLRIEAIDTAWRAVRDLSNIVFVFILIYISIMTILQAGNFQTKKILTSLIIIALLVNFSLFFTEVIIDVTNILASAFHQQIIAVGERGLSATLADGLKIQTLFEESFLSNLTNEKLLVGYVMGIVVSLIAAFSFGTAALMFIVRSVVLMFLMVLSPLAFVARILPLTEKYFSMWWRALLRYSFYAPAYIVLIMLTVMIINGGELLNLSSEKSFSAVLEGWFSGNPDSSFMGVFFQFGMVVGLIYGSYYLAKQFGIAGADTVMKGANRVRKWGQGAVVGGVVGGVGGAVLGGTRQFTRGVLGKGAEATLEDDSFAGRMLRAVPGSRAALAKIGQKGREDVEKQQEALKGYSDAAVQRLSSSTFASSQKREAAQRELASRKNLKTEGGVTGESIAKGLKSMERRGFGKKATKEISNRAWQYENLATLAQTEEGREEVMEILKKVPRDSMGDLDKELFDDPNVRESMYRAFNKSKMEKLYEEKSELVTKLVEGMVDKFETDNPDELSDALGEIGNKSLGAWLRSPAGKNELGTPDEEGGVSAEEAEKKLKEQLNQLNDN